MAASRLLPAVEHRLKVALSGRAKMIERISKLPGRVAQSRNKALGLLLALSFVASCKGASSQKTDLADATHRAVQPVDTQISTDATDSATGCRDWSTLELASLAPLPASPYSAVFDQVWQTALQKGLDPTMGCRDWPAMRMEFGARVARASNVQEAYAAINALLSELEQSHFLAIPPSAKQRLPLAGGPAKIKLATQWIGESLVVRAARPGEAKASLPPGTQILAIDGVPLAELIDSEATATVRSTELDYLWSCGNSVARSLKIKEPTAKGPTTWSGLCELAAGQRIDFGNLHGVVADVHAQLLDAAHAIGYLRFSAWMLPMVSQISDAVVGLQSQGMQHLIVDLRGNPGGVATMTIPIARLFLAQGASLGTLYMRGFSQELLVRANEQAFRGSLTILVDEGTASTSEIFAMGLHDLDRASIVAAQQSAKMALPSLIEGLQDGGLLQYAVGRYESPRHGAPEGIGVPIDIRVNQTLAAVVAGEDAVLKAAVDHVIATAPSQAANSRAPASDGR